MADQLLVNIFYKYFFLKNCVKLLLNYNYYICLGSLPTEIANLNKLTKLILKNNSFSGKILDL